MRIAYRRYSKHFFQIEENYNKHLNGTPKPYWQSYYTELYLGNTNNKESKSPIPVIGHQVVQYLCKIDYNNTICFNVMNEKRGDQWELQLSKTKGD